MSEGSAVFVFTVGELAARVEDGTNLAKAEEEPELGASHWEAVALKGRFWFNMKITIYREMTHIVWPV
jgi:hypothetical protein